eukprot:6378906-Amphidinium_carterae.1
MFEQNVPKCSDMHGTVNQSNRGFSPNGAWHSYLSVRAALVATVTRCCASLRLMSPAHALKDLP